MYFATYFRVISIIIMVIFLDLLFASFSCPAVITAFADGFTLGKHVIIIICNLVHLDSSRCEREAAVLRFLNNLFKSKRNY